MADRVEGIGEVKPEDHQLLAPLAGVVDQRLEVENLPLDIESRRAPSCSGSRIPCSSRILLRLSFRMMERNFMAVGRRQTGSQSYMSRAGNLLAKKRMQQPLHSSRIDPVRSASLSTARRTCLTSTSKVRTQFN